MTSSVSPDCSRSSSSLVRTHVIGQRSELTSSERTTSGTVAAGMRRPSYLILHGYQGSGPGHWQTWLAGRLRSGDAAVHYPDLPDADAPALHALAGRAARRARRDRRAADRRLPLAGVRAVAASRRRGRRRRRARAARRAAVAGRASRTCWPGSSRCRTWSRRTRGWSAPTTIRTAPRARTRSIPGRPTSCPGQGHINPDAGYGPWPAVEAWAREGTVPLTAR